MKTAAGNSPYHRGSGAVPTHQDTALPVREIPESRLITLLEKSVSQRNFAVLCMRELFTEEERVNATISGERGNRKLDPSGERLKLIYKYLMQTCRPGNDNPQTIWEDCQTAMNKANIYLRSTRTDINYAGTN